MASEELVKKKVELLALQQAKADRIYELLNGPGGFNDHSRKTLKNLDAAITASKRPGYFSYYEPPEHVKELVRSGEVDRLHEQLIQLQKQINQVSEKIGKEQQAALMVVKSPSPDRDPVTTASVHNMKQWFATYGSPKQTQSDQYTSFTPEKKVYGGTRQYSAFRSQASTMKKGRLTK